jgi:hypothetical protein
LPIHKRIGTSLDSTRGALPQPERRKNIPVKELTIGEIMEKGGSERIVLSPLACPNCSVLRSANEWTKTEVREI